MTEHRGNDGRNQVPVFKFGESTNLWGESGVGTTLTLEGVFYD